MKKEDLKTGMLVQLRIGWVQIVISDSLVGADSGYDELDNYNKDLTHKSLRELDIMKISKVLVNKDLKPNNWMEETLNNNLLWQRKSFEEMEVWELFREYRIKTELDNFYFIQFFDDGSGSIRKNSEKIHINFPSKTNIKQWLIKQITK